MITKLENANDIDKTVEIRENTYGGFENNAIAAQELKAVLRKYTTSLPYVHAEALEVIMQKISRILTGDHNYIDNWHDIQGYAKLVEIYIKKDPWYEGK